MFRTADGLGLEKLYLCGITPTPENDAVRKTSLGAEESVQWEYARDAVKLAKRLKAEGVALWGLEQDERAVRLGPRTDGETEKRIWATGGMDRANQRIVLVVGNEVTGTDPGLLDLCDQIVYIPMRGSKRSLNVEVAFAIAAWVINEY
jgi:tRNA G18 (ribose-2'-O)-methylase SpoU